MTQNSSEIRLSDRKCGSCRDLIPMGDFPLCCDCGEFFHFSIDKLKPNCSGIVPNSWRHGGDSYRSSWACPPCRIKRKSSKATISNSASVAANRGSASNKSAEDTGHSQTLTQSQSTTQNMINEILNSPSTDPSQIVFSQQSQSSADSIPPSQTAAFAELTCQFFDTAALESGNLDPSMIPEGVDIRILFVAFANFVARSVVRFESLADQMAGRREESVREKEMIQKLLNESEAIKREIVVMKREMDHLKTENAQLRAERRADQQHGRLRNVVISNAAPVNTEEEAFQAIRSIATAAGTTISEGDIDIAHRLPTRVGPSKIIARFVTQRKKMTFQRAIRDSRITGEAIGWRGLTKPIIAADHLLPETAALLKTAKEALLVKNGGRYKFVWIKGYVIMARLKEGDQAKFIRTIEDIKELVEAK